MSYKEFIENILNTRGRFACGNEYHERHHIIPRCLGGTNDEENLIDLFAREHFEAHRLLALENPDIKGLTYAWWNMTHTNKANQRNYKITVEEYEEAKMSCSKIKSEYRHSDVSRQKIKENHVDINGVNNPFYGKHHSEELKKKLSKMRSRAVRCVETDVIYDSAKVAQEKIGICNSNIGKCCRGRQETAGGFHWEFVEEKEN